ncbi:hypothetical protein CRUP_031701 [Coryphaenoides rupestris]|nr:hypothetical protein CRUP_031701 [Coryphaenoides rupestris]
MMSTLTDLLKGMVPSIAASRDGRLSAPSAQPGLEGVEELYARRRRTSTCPGVASRSSATTRPVVNFSGLSDSPVGSMMVAVARVLCRVLMRSTGLLEESRGSSSSFPTKLSWKWGSSLRNCLGQQLAAEVGGAEVCSAGQLRLEFPQPPEAVDGVDPVQAVLEKDLGRLHSRARTSGRVHQLHHGTPPSPGPKLEGTETHQVRQAVSQDSSRDIREALHELLCYTNVSTKECVQLALLELLKNLTKYPSDRNSVWKCLKFLGSRHPTLVLPLVPELLSTHPYFDTPEPDMDDPAYIAVLVLVFNAAKPCTKAPQAPEAIRLTALESRRSLGASSAHFLPEENSPEAYSSLARSWDRGAFSVVGQLRTNRQQCVHQLGQNLSGMKPEVLERRPSRETIFSLTELYCRASVEQDALHRSTCRAADLLGLERRSFFTGASSGGIYRRKKTQL